MKSDFYQEAERQITSGYFSPIEGFEYGARWMRDEATKLIEEISVQIMDAHETEDWQGIAHIALDIMPRLLKDYGTNYDKTHEPYTKR